MQNALFDIGLQEYEMPGGVLKFNPNDPNVYRRFLDAGPRVQEIEDQLVEEGRKVQEGAVGADVGKTVLDVLARADAEVKGILNEVFGQPNDFDTLLQGVNVMAVAKNGERVITNLFAALNPILRSAAETCAATMTGDAVASAKAARQERLDAQAGQ